ncbi:cyclic lactone autoinducer peptide [Saccharibacillus alkalitolerans]|uniref:Cyclic lactone autoinducer peptide n=1 Tax=Saccharibacillus alkalitolerans TaxID=2705290 RepID=A0ABX0F4G0_9BACL|nr:cyclic lactone autoinducer peptide [Saccharibacillus alkalitolerans]NGZ75310.1 cyclic lactone autoinducer peptide [Saccharibacillus alkalitolerans]
MKESLINTFVKFGEMSIGSCCAFAFYEPEIPYELKKDMEEEIMEDLDK